MVITVLDTVLAEEELELEVALAELEESVEAEADNTVEEDELEEGE